jgi:hydrogenase-4 component E
LSAAPFADAIPNFAGAAMLLLGLLLPLRRGGAAAARLVAAQGGLLALAAASAAWGGSGPHLWLLALGAFAGRALLLPTLLRLASGRAADTSPRPRAAAAPVPGAVSSLVAGGALAVLAVAAVMTAGAGMEPGAREGSALALATLLAGLLAMVSRRGVLFGLLGLLAAENGALLGVVHAGGGAPGAAALAVLSPGLVFCVLLAATRGRGALAAALPWAPRR